MRRIAVVAIALCCLALLAGPAAAVDVEFGGDYWAKGYSHSHEDLRDTSSTSAFMEMRFDFDTKFLVSDRLSLNTRIRALDRVWGTEDEETDDNVDFRSAYMTIKTSLGGLVVGRYETTTFGTPLADSTGPRDRIIYVLPVANWTFAAFVQKSNEFDKGTEVADADNHKWAIVSIYKAENFNAGFLWGIYDYKTIPVPIQYQNFITAYQNYQQLNSAAQVAVGTVAGVAQYEQAGLVPAGSTSAAADAAAVAQGQALAAGAAIANGPATVEGLAHVPEFFIKGSLGDFSYEFEIDYAFGETTNATDGIDDRDVKAFEWVAEGAYQFGPFQVRAGYLYITGDDDITDDTFEAFAYLEESAEVDKAFILTGTNENKHGAGLQETLGGFGNIAAGPVTTSPTVLAGLKLLYFGAKFNVREDMWLDLMVAKAEAEAPMQGWDSDQGYEYDLTLNWDIYDNLNFRGVVAYLDAGDWWKGGDPTAQIEDTYTVYGALILSF